MKYAVYIMILAVGLLTGCGKTDDETVSGKEPVTITEEVPVKSVEPAVVTQEQPAKPVPQKAPAKSKHVPNAQTGEKLADELCASCHGMNGTHTELGSPFIAGLDKDYIAASLHGYRKGSRNISTLQALADKLKVMKKLNSEQIADVSAYYASLDTPWQGDDVAGLPPQKSALSFDKEDIAVGAEIAKRCNSCHGEEGNSVTHPDAPSLAAMPPDYFIYSLKTYFDGSRKHAVMATFGMGKSLGEREIEQLAAYYAVQMPKKPPVSKLGNAIIGEAVAGDCGGCHGLDGNTLNPSLPNLTGQPVEYLVLAMKDYRDGRRKDPAMKFALQDMSDGRITDLAAYYATQEPVSLFRWVMQSSEEFRPLEDGRRIARMCDSCHGRNGNSTKPGVPSLTGLTARYLTEATIAYRDGAWKHDAMREMVSFLDDGDIEKVSYYYALQEPVVTKKPAKFDLAAGKKISPACILCHSDEGIKQDPRIPNLNGQDHQYLIDATLAYGNGGRFDEDMSKIAEAIKAQDISNLVNVAGFYAVQQVNKPHTVMPQPPMKTIEKCHRCHGEKGEISTSGIPRLAGQSELYLVQAMKAYQDKRRQHKDMNQLSDELSLIEMKGMAAYYARQ